MCEKSGRVHNDINISRDKAIKSLLAKLLLKKCKMCCLLSLIKNSEKMYLLLSGASYQYPCPCKFVGFVLIMKNAKYFLFHSVKKVDIMLFCDKIIIWPVFM